MARTFDTLRSEYAELWRSMRVREDKIATADAAARRIIAAKARYVAVEALTGVPWFVIGIIHRLECGGSFAKHLHNGDPLTARTVQVPKGRPKSGEPPFSWEESAVDALRYDGLDEVESWSPERIAFELEGYNGWGYRRHHPDVLSPYLWSFSNHYSSGKYVADGKWSQSAVSGQVGAMVLLRRLISIDPSIRFGVIATPPAPSEPAEAAKAAPAAPPSEETVKSVQRRLRELGYSEVGNVDGEFGGRTRGAILAFRGDAHLPLAPVIDADLLVALAGAKPRQISESRATASDKDVAAKVPGVAAARTSRLWALAQTVAAAVFAFLTGIVDNLGAATDKIRPVKEFLGAVPAWVWPVAVAGVSFALWRASRRAEKDTVDAYREARLM